MPYQRRTFWTQKVDCHNPITNFTIHTLNDLDPINIYEDKCVLYLPDSYTPDGDPTKVILYCKQGASEITSSTDQIVDQCAFFLKLGYAILAVEGIPDGLCDEKKIGKRTVGNYIHAQSMTKAYEKVVELYNIDPKGCYAYGWSQGGHTLQNLLDNTSLPILCAAAQSPVVSIRYHQWDLSATATHGGVQYTKDARLSIARLFDYPAVSNNTELLALSYDASKTNGWDPYTRNVDNPYTGFVQSGNLWYFPSGTTTDDITMVKRMRCPFKAWVADNDTALGADVTKAFVKAIKNSGQVAEIKCYSTGAHSIPAAQSTISTFVEHGVTQNLKPLYLEMAQWFEKYGGYSTEGYSPTPGPTPDPDALPLTDYALSITSANAGRVVEASNRVSTASSTTANGILVPGRMAITITGLKPTGYPTLRVDALWATSSGPNPTATGVWSETVGTLSNYVSTDYFPLNVDGSSDTVTIENNTDNDYYYFFAFAATNMTDAIQAANYDLHYSIDEIPEPVGVLPLTNGGINITSTNTGCMTSATTTRLSSGSATVANGILVKAGETITLTGLEATGKPTLRVDYLYATSAGPNPAVGSGVWSSIVGTGSNFDPNIYFPLNIDGSNNSVSVTNTYDNDYYYFFVFAATNMTDTLTASDYTITYEITTNPSGTLPLYSNTMMSVTSLDGGQIFDAAKGQTGLRLTSGSSTTVTGILVKNGESITLTGLQSSGHPTLRVDYLYCTTAGPAPYAGTISGIWDQVAGTGSNWVAANYFPLNIEGNNTVTVTNNTGSDYYYFFCFSGPAKTESIDSSWYNITYVIEHGPVVTNLPLNNGSVNLTTTTTGTYNANNSLRLTSASDTVATGILLQPNETITLTGLKSTGYPTLRVDYLYATDDGPNPLAAAGSWSAVVGTGSNYVTADYFPLNADGSSNSVSVTNTYGQAYYFQFAFAGPNKSETLVASNYHITYTIS